MRQYLDMLQYILDNGERVPTRAVLKSTGETVDAISVLGYQNRYDLRAGFPAVTTKKLYWKGVVAELLWFLAGDTWARTLQNQDVTIWNGWIRDPQTTDCGPIYGKQWRAWDAPRSPSEIASMMISHGNDIIAVRERMVAEKMTAEEALVAAAPVAMKHAGDMQAGLFTRPIDQIANLIAGIEAVKADPNASIARRLIVTAWNPADIEKMGLPACHVMSQWTVRNGGLHCHMYQRSADTLLGVPFNIASYALLTHMIAQVTGLEAREFIHTLHDAHVYSNHLDQVREQLSREPRSLPRLRLNPQVRRLEDFRIEDIQLDGYDPHPAIKAEVAI